MLCSKIRLILFAFVAPLLLTADPSWASGPGYMTVVGAQQGPIEGDVTSPGQEGTFEIQELHHLSAAGAQGAEHQALIVTTRLSRGIPRLMGALDSGESLNVSIEYEGNDPASGERIDLYTFALQNARLVIGEPIIADILQAETSQLPLRIRLRFEFEIIRHTYEVTGETIEF